MTKPVLKNASYILVHTPDMIIHNGTTYQMEKLGNPDSEFLKNVGNFIRNYEEVVNYAPNQVYIGNKKPEELNDVATPWFENPVQGTREGRFWRNHASG